MYGWRVSASVRGKVALITGGARGVGAATASQLVARGARVVLVDLDADPLRELVERLGEDSATSIIGDVTELADMEEAVAHGVERFGGDRHRGGERGDRELRLGGGRRPGDLPAA